MRTSKRFLHVALSCVSALALPGALTPLAAQQMQSSIVSELPAPANSQAVAPQDLPDSPGATLAKMEALDQQQAPVSSPQANSSANAPAQSAPQRPVGTATAEAPDTSGVAASQPAGVAIAPAKQRRVRTIVIKVGAIIAAGAAVGAVIALTEATGSKPPGAH
jgi:hypothetical protein